LLVEEVEVGADTARERRLAATEQQWPDEQVALVDESRRERVGGELGAADRQVTGSCRLQGGDRAGVESYIRRPYRQVPTGRTRSVMKVNTSSLGADQSMLPCSSSTKPSTDTLAM
jgi:hypothetical protein